MGVLTNETYKTNQTRFSFCHLGQAPGVGLWGAGCTPGVNNLFFKMAYQIDEQNRVQVNFSSLGQTVDPGLRSNIIKFQLPCQFQRFLYQTLCVFSPMKDTKHVRWDFHSVTWVMLHPVLGVPRGSKKFFSNMVLWHIKSIGMTCRTECK